MIGSKRIYAMDSMRATLMMLGIVIHSAQVFNPQQTWLIYSQNTTDIANYLVQIISTFRMPAFFVLSGVFCSYALIKYSPKEFAINKFNRVCIPLIVTALVFNPLQGVLLANFGWLNFNMNRYFVEGVHVSHLWFLINIIVYFSFYLLITTFFRCNKISSSLMKFLEKNVSPLLLIVVFLPVLSMALFDIHRFHGFLLYEKFWYTLDMHSLLKYFPYFTFGFLIGHSKTIFYGFTNFPPHKSVFIIVLAIVFQREVDFSISILNEFFKAYLDYLIYWSSVSLCFYFFFHIFNRPLKIWSVLSDASYSIYLVHHIIVIALALVLVNVNVPSVFAMVFLILLTAIFSLFFHRWFVLRFKQLRWLFNGK